MDAGAETKASSGLQWAHFRNLLVRFGWIALRSAAMRLINSDYNGLIVCGMVMIGMLGRSSAHEPAEGYSEPLHHLDELVFLKTGDPLADWKSVRTWTASDGRKLQAKILKVENNTVTLLLQNRRETTIDLSRLAEEDQRFVVEWREISQFFNLGYQPSRKLKNTVEAGLMAGAFAKDGKIHETLHFRFECDEPLSAAVVKDFSRLFEATYLAVQSLPIGLAPAVPKNGKFVVRLFANQDDYLTAGGEKDAAGIYLTQERVILVPLASLGLTPGRKGFRKTTDYDPTTLIHETTHAVTHQWIHILPMWFNEGMAEYIAAVPYRDGTLNFGGLQGGLRQQIVNRFGKDGTRFPFVSVAELVELDGWVFMGKPTKETPIALDPVEPLEIERLLTGKESRSDSLVSEIKPLPISPDVTHGTGQPGQYDPAISQRYGASMLLVNQLLESGQAEGLRKYMFAFLKYEWDRTKYLEKHRLSYNKHRADLIAQVDKVSSEIKRYNREIDTYNDEVDRYNAGRIKKLPADPVKPAFPKTLPVPEILANPRSSDELSRLVFRKKAAKSNLSLPSKFQLP